MLWKPKISSTDPRKLDIQFKQGGSVITSAFSSGEVGGLLAFQDQVLDPAQNKLGLMAAGLAQTFNDQHELGMDLNGALGGDFFNSGVPTVGSKADNTGTGAFTATITDIGKVQPSDYEVKYDGPIIQRCGFPIKRPYSAAVICGIEYGIRQ